MRYTQLVVLLFISVAVYSQPFIHIRPGQKFRENEKNCLLIKNDKNSLSKLSSLSTYSSVTNLKLINFNGPDLELDSLLFDIFRQIHPKLIVFENCDLENLTNILPFVALEEIRITKKSSFFENNLFYVLKNNPIKRIKLQQAQTEFSTDSLYLLPKLEEVQISNSLDFTRANKSVDFRIIAGGNIKDIKLTYYGDLNKEGKTEELSAELKTIVKENEQFLPMKPLQFPCVRQPIPNININDTLYYFRSDLAQEFYYESGSKIMLDGDAFLTESDEPYDGVIRLFYREFRNPVEIMLSGIPMTNHVNGEEKLFKSGGMYEVRAFDEKGNELKTKNDSALKINFALTDTSSSFEFFSLKQEGGWTTSPSKVISVLPNSSANGSSQVSRAIQEYCGYLRSGSRRLADTTNFYERFADTNYLYVYRRDNFRMHKDKKHYSVGDYNRIKLKGFFRVKYLKQTKDKKILFTLVESQYTIPGPSYARVPLNRTYLYTGNLTKEEFRKKFHRKLYGWDIQCSGAGNSVTMRIKTTHGFESITCEVATVFPDGYYRATENSGKQFSNRFNRLLNNEAKRFNKRHKTPPSHGRFYAGDCNNVNVTTITPELAFEYSKKFQTPDELRLDFEGWKNYIKAKAPDIYANSFQYSNEVGSALVKSGMGIKNIDCYIHSGEMENIFVNYNNVDLDTLSYQFHVMLYKTINTSYGLGKNYGSLSSLTGYYFKNKPNYLIRFSDNGYMQVTRPASVRNLKTENEIALEYRNEYLVKGLTSDEITKLILE